MAETKKYAQWIDIPDGNGGAERKWLKDAEARDAILHPIDINTLTPSSTFVKNAIIGINGVIDRAKQATSSMPMTMVVQDGAFVVHIVNGRKAFVVADFTLNPDWEVWTDAGMSYAYAQLDAAKLELSSVITYNGQQYTVGQLLNAVASLIGKTLVTPY
jgi:hypothetical protein